jgi:hypothetical protein
VITDRQGIEAADCYEERSILDYFAELPNWSSLDGLEEDKSGRTQQGQAPVFSVKPVFLLVSAFIMIFRSAC